MYTRPAAVAGRFYPSAPGTLHQQLDALLEQNRPRLTRPHVPKALIVPHSNYAYSGKTAAIGYQCLLPYAQEIKKVIIVGVSHNVAFRGVATTGARYFSTPLGDVRVDRELLDKVLKIPFVHVREDACQHEQSLETHLPFLQKTIGMFEFIPLLAGQSSGDALLLCLKKLFKEKGVLIVVSSDLSYVHSYDDAIIADRDTCNQIVSKNATITRSQATGYRGINTLLKLVQPSQFHISMLDYRNSGDTAGDNECVVGYASFFISENKR